MVDHRLDGRVFTTAFVSLTIPGSRLFVALKMIHVFAGNIKCGEKE